jgi:hypothetical protein
MYNTVNLTIHFIERLNNNKYILNTNENSFWNPFQLKLQQRALAPSLTAFRNFAVHSVEVAVEAHSHLGVLALVGIAHRGNALQHAATAAVNRLESE